MAQKINVVGKQTISLTFGDAGENHVGNQMIGKFGDEGDGFTCEELQQLCVECDGEYHDFGNDAGIAVFKGLIDEEMQNAMLLEMNSFEWDQKFYDIRRKKVLNKHARTNVTFLEGESQEPNYEEAKGRIVNSHVLPLFTEFRGFVLKRFSDVLENSTKFQDLVCEGNNYYDNTKCGIGYHGDGERRRVIALRWFQNSSPQGDAFEFVFNGGDLYIMSEIAVGTNWKKKKIMTLRHSAGCSKYTDIPPKKEKKEKKEKK